MKYPLLNYVNVIWIPIFIASLFTTAYIVFTMQLPILPIAAPFVFIAITAYIVYAYIIRPEIVILAGKLRFRTPPEFEQKIKAVITKHTPHIPHSAVVIHCIEDPGSAFWYFSSPHTIHFVISSSLYTDLNEIDIENIMTYLLNLHGFSNPLKDTIILALATTLEKIMILQTIGSALVHMVRSVGFDLAIDKRVVEVLRYTKGYQSTLNKMKELETRASYFWPCVSMNAFVDVHCIQPWVKPLSHVHEAIDTRIAQIESID